MVQCPHNADAREHRRAAERRDQDHSRGGRDSPLSTIISFGSIRVFSERTWSATGASCNCLSGFIDERALCAIATEVPTSASKAIVVVTFSMMGLRVVPGPLQGSW